MHADNQLQFLSTKPLFLQMNEKSRAWMLVKSTLFFIAGASFVMDGRPVPKKQAATEPIRQFSTVMDKHDA